MSFNQELIGIDRDITINAYYNRDKEMSLNNQIIQHLTKLEYYNIDSVSENKKFLNYMLRKTISVDTDNDNTTVNDLINQIKTSEEYRSFQNNLSLRITRSIQLSGHINSMQNDCLEFYKNLTLDELNYLGY